MAEIGRDPFLLCNTDSFWIEGPRSNIARLAEAFDPGRMDFILLVAASAGAVGVDWPGDFTMSHDGRLGPRESRHVAPFVYTGVGIVKPELFENETAEVFRLAPFFHAAAAEGRLFGLRLDGLWLHVGRPESDRRGGARDRPVDPLRTRRFQTLNSSLSTVCGAISGRVQPSVGRAMTGFAAAAFAARLPASRRAAQGERDRQKRTTRLRGYLTNAYSI